MAKFNEILGSLLRDLAYARVKSDLFAREASLEYLKDPLLKLFPVPRIEMAQAEIELSFAIKDARQAESDPKEVARQVFAENLSALRDALLAVTGKNGRAAKAAQDTLAGLLGGARAAAENDLSAQLNKVFHDGEGRLEAQLLNDPDGLAQTFSPAGLAALRTIAAKNGLTVTFGAAQQSEISKRVGVWAKTVNQAAQAALERARANAFELDLAVTRDELEKIAPHLLARVKLNVTIENYEWAETEDEDGRPLNKLVMR